MCPGTKHGIIVSWRCIVLKWLRCVPRRNKFLQVLALHFNNSKVRKCIDMERICWSGIGMRMNLERGIIHDNYNPAIKVMYLGGLLKLFVSVLSSIVCLAGLSGCENHSYTILFAPIFFYIILFLICNNQINFVRNYMPFFAHLELYIEEIGYGWARLR